MAILNFWVKVHHRNCHFDIQKSPILTPYSDGNLIQHQHLLCPSPFSLRAQHLFMTVILLFLLPMGSISFLLPDDSVWQIAPQGARKRGD